MSFQELFDAADVVMSFSDTQIDESMSCSELKPCPFCGGKGQLQHTTLMQVKNRDSETAKPLRLYLCGCSDCGAETFPYSEAPEKAVDLWQKGFVFEAE